MPEIKEYVAPLAEGRPSDLGAEAFAQAGRRIGTFYHQEGEEIGQGIRAVGQPADAFITHQEVVHGALGYAGLLSDMTTKWNQTAKNADPNDPTVGAKFQRDVLEPALDNFQNGFATDKGAAWAENRVAALRDHFFEKTAADMSTLAGQSVQSNLGKLAATYSTTALQDLSSVHAAMDGVNSSIDAILASSPNMTADQAGEIRTKMADTINKGIVRSAAYGAIEKNPEHGLDAILADKKLAPYLDGVEVKQFQTFAQGQQRLAQVQQRQIEAENARRDNENAETKVGQSIHDNTTVKNGKLVITNPDAWMNDARNLALQPQGAKHVETMVHFGETLLADSAKDQTNAYDPFALAAIQEKIAAGEMNNNGLMMARNQHQINDKQFDELSKTQRESAQFTEQGPLVTNLLATLKDGITPTIPGLPPNVEAQKSYTSAVSEFLRQWQTMTPQERFKAGNAADPNSLVSTLIGKYASDDQKKLNNALKSMAIPGPAGGPAQTPKADIFIDSAKVPDNLRNLADAKSLGHKGNQWRDMKTGQIYDAGGEPVK